MHTVVGYRRDLDISTTIILMAILMLKDLDECLCDFYLCVSYRLYSGVGPSGQCVIQIFCVCIQS